MSLLFALSLSATVILVYVSFLFVTSIILKRNDIADAGWGIGVLLVGLVAYVAQGSPSPLSSLLLLLITIWAVRLSFRIFVRNAKKTEDVRYKKWRESWGSWFYIRSFFQVYLLQGALMMVVGYPLFHVVVYTEKFPIGMTAIIGSIIWCIGFVFESVSDHQLDTFLTQEKNAGKLMQKGLWRYSRHPNYFGEVLMWWGIWYIALFVPYGVFAIISPLTITFLILFVSGVPMLEAHMRTHPDFESYAKRTSVFIPFPPKERA